jgi:hypothetical protein
MTETRPFLLTNEKLTREPGTRKSNRIKTPEHYLISSTFTTAKKKKTLSVSLLIFSSTFTTDF